MGSFAALTIQSGTTKQLQSADTLLSGAGIDASVAGAFAIGAANAGAISIGRTGQTVTFLGNVAVTGSLAVTGTTIPGMTVSGLTSGQAAYLSAANVATATDNGTLSKSRIVGVYEGVTNTLQGTGLINDAQFTTAGGAPAAGAPVYLAAAADDTGAGAGKFTATPPTTGNVAEVGICLDPANYASAKTVKIFLQPKTVVAL